MLVLFRTMFTRSAVFRSCVVAVVAVASVFLVHATARAEVEYCPAAVTMNPIGVADNEPSTTYSVLLAGESARVVTGDVAMHTSDGNWFTAHFANVPLTAYKEQWQTGFGGFVRTDYVSPTLYVKFPQPVSIASDFVSDAQATDETVFGWSAKGVVACPGKGDKKPKPASKGAPHLMNPVAQMKLPPTSTSQILPTAVAAAPGPTDCDVPFRDAASIAVAQAEYPRGDVPMDGNPYHTSLVAVALNSKGRIDDAWIWGTSGDRFMDGAALRAARLSTYRPARAFCSNVPGIYLFHVDFEQ